jgi:histone deacetylase HOS3
MDAIQGAIGTVCEAVDTVVRSSRNADNVPMSTTRPDVFGTRAFVSIRPPGHHCGAASPSGFCFVNNVVVAAAHGGIFTRLL